jgi:hypothetical protein
MATPKSHSTLNIKERVRLATDMLADIANENNLYAFIGIGKNTTWNISDTYVESPLQTIDYENQLRRNLVAIKKLSLSNAAVVARRKDWVANTYYDRCTSNDEMYSTISMSNANGLITLTNSSSVVGVNTTFLLDYANNSFMTLPGDGIFIQAQTKEVVNVVSNTAITVNSAFVGTFTANVPQKQVNFAPNYAKNFYVRNSYDQVFVCLDNNFNALSTDMPKISLGGQLPTDPYITAADGYRWKYLYTISGGMKQSFLTSEWMPVVTETAVAIGAVDGSLNLIRILNGGTGYNNTAASFSAPIIVVTGDGTGANLTAQVDANGTIYGVNILNAGTGYTKANISVNVGSSGANANLQAVIGPPGGWGTNAAMQLGATTAMFSVNFTDTESGTLPTVDAIGNYFKYRQLSLIQSPYLLAGGTANGTNYDMTTKVTVSANTPFAMNDIVYQSPTGLYANATFSATVVYFDNSTNQLHLNNLNGSFVTLSPIYGTHAINTAPYTTVTAFSSTNPLVKTFSGDLLYVENRAPITRSPGQAENIKLIISF